MSKTGKDALRQMEPNKPRNKCRKWKLRVSIGLNPRTGNYGKKPKAIPIQEKLIEYLLSWKEEQAQLMRKWKVSQDNETYVCATNWATGSTMTYSDAGGRGTERSSDARVPTFTTYATHLQQT